MDDAQRPLDGGRPLPDGGRDTGAEHDRESERDRGHDREDERGHEHGDGHDHGEAGTHDHHVHDVETLSVAVVTVSTSRAGAGDPDDPAGDAIVEAFEAAGHELTIREVVPDSHDEVQGKINALVNRNDVDAVVTTGGTGVTPDDVTVEAATPLFDKELPGFGELFRRLSYDEIGTRIVGTRAVAGVADATPVFCLPGSENAARLGAEEIVVEEAGHLAGLARRDENGKEKEEKEKDRGSAPDVGADEGDDTEE